MSLASSNSNSPTVGDVTRSLTQPAETESRLKKKFRESPFMVVGVAGCVFVASFGLYNMKNRKIRPSIYLMQLRVAAQGTVVACLTGGVLIDLYGRLTKKEPNTTSADDKKN